MHFRISNNVHNSAAEDADAGAGIVKPVAAMDPAAASPVFKNDRLDIFCAMAPDPLY